jgi:hypothetical protein
MVRAIGASWLKHGLLAVLHLYEARRRACVRLSTSYWSCPVCVWCGRAAGAQFRKIRTTPSLVCVHHQGKTYHQIMYIRRDKNASSRAVVQSRLYHFPCDTTLSFSSESSRDLAQDEHRFMATMPIAKAKAVAGGGGGDSAGGAVVTAAAAERLLV